MLSSPAEGGGARLLFPLIPKIAWDLGRMPTGTGRLHLPGEQMDTICVWPPVGRLRLGFDIGDAVFSGYRVVGAKDVRLAV